MRESLALYALCAALSCYLISSNASGAELRDPTRPYRAVAPGASVPAGFSVNAIIISAERRVAIVNGRRVGIGGVVDGARIVEINRDHLILQKDGKRITAALRNKAKP